MSLTKPPELALTATALPSAAAIRLSPSWSLWPLAALRSAGLPAERVNLLQADREGEPALDDQRLIAGLSRDDRFTQALSWQNPRLVENWFLRLDREACDERGAGRPGRIRKRAAALAQYLQRYAVKNDTIGAFGPVGWATLDDRRPTALACFPGPGLIRHRSVHFETWAVDAIARSWEGDPSLRAWLPPIRDASSFVQGDRLHRLRGEPLRLAPEEVAVLRCCDGRAPVEEIRRRLAAEIGTALSAEELRSLLYSLHRRGLVRWGFRIPIDDHPEEHLRRQLDTIGDVEVRRRYLGRLTGLLQARDEVAAGTEDYRTLLGALGRLGSLIADTIGRPPLRGKEESPTARGFVYEDAVRDVEVTIGRPLIEALAPAIDPLLASARWFTFALATAFRLRIAGAFQELGRGAPEVSLPRLLWAIGPELQGTESSPVWAVREEFQHRWASALGEQPASGPWALSADAVGPTARRVFEAPTYGWAGARYHSPDLLLAAESVEAVNRGRYLVVLGELHIGLNTLENRVFANRAPDVGALAAAVARDLRGGRVVPVFPKTSFEVGPRSYPPLAFHVPGRYAYWSLEDFDGIPFEAEIVPAAELRAYLAKDGSVRVWTGDGRLDVDVIELLGEMLTILAVNAFELLAPARHRPRLTIDRLVVSRASWAVEALDLARFAGRRTRGAEACAFLRDRGLPDAFFVKNPAERKPFYVDLRSPHLVRMLLQSAARSAPPSPAAPLTLTEVLPGLDQLWLHDAEGRRYTSEFRLVAVDQADHPLVLSA